MTVPRCHRACYQYWVNFTWTDPYPCFIPYWILQLFGFSRILKRKVTQLQKFFIKNYWLFKPLRAVLTGYKANYKLSLPVDDEIENEIKMRLFENWDFSTGFSSIYCLCQSVFSLSYFNVFQVILLSRCLFCELFCSSYVVRVPEYIQYNGVDPLPANGPL